MARWYPDPGALKSIEVIYVPIGGIGARVILDKEPIRVGFGGPVALQNISAVMSGEMTMMQAVLRELVELRERVAVLEGSGDPPTFESEEELGEYLKAQVQPLESA